MAIKTYSSEDVAVIVAGRNVSNRSDDFCTVAMEEDAFMHSVGSDGEGSRSLNPNRSGTITITLKQTSDDNLFMSALHTTDLNTKLGTFPILVKDTNGNSLYEGTEAWIVKSADAGFNKEVGDREWTVKCNKLIMVNAGSF